MNMDEATTSKIYDCWSKIYDHSFALLVGNRQRRAVEQLRLQPGDRVLDLGVGTGMMLHAYPCYVTVVGMDLSGGMLRRAADKRSQLGLGHCQLLQADAMVPPFAEMSFDHVMISHTISVVSGPDRLLNLAAKLIKPGGRIVLLNHFQSTHPMIAWFEKVLNPIFMKIGWRSDLPMEDVLRGADVEVEYCFKMRLVDIWRIVVLKQPRLPRRRPSKELSLDVVATGQLAMGNVH